MARFMSLAEAVAATVHDGDVVAMEGFTHLIPFAAGHEVIRQGRRRLTLVRMTPDLIYDQLIGMGCAARLVFSWSGNPGVGSLHRIRDAIENGWPAPLETEEHSHAAMACAYEAGAAGLPFAVLRGYRGVQLPAVNPNIRPITCPFTGETLAAVPAIRADVAVIHAQRADAEGNVLVEGIVGVQKEAVLGARRALVTVEEVVDTFGPRSPNAVILPRWVVTAIAVVPGGARPSYAHGYYRRDNAFYKAWDAVSRDRDAFRAWMEANVLRRAGVGD
ncbi:MAG TPA: CoA-transferase [Thermodesulfobacteriota bacterium]